MSSILSWQGRALTVAAVMASSSGLATGQIFTPVVPDFEPAAIFEVLGAAPYGIASADVVRVVDDDPIAGQDGYPEVAIACAGVNLFHYCNDPPFDTYIVVFRNTGNWDPDPTQGLVEHQVLDIPDGIAATELAFADVTGENGKDLVLLGYDSDVGKGYLLIYKNHGNGLFDNGSSGELPDRYEVSGVSFRGLVAEDLDLDGDIDVAAAVSDCMPSDSVVVFENAPDQNGLSFVAHTIPLNTGYGDGAGDIVAGDFFPFGGGGGQPLVDLVTPNTGSPSISKIANLGNLNFAPVNENQPGGCAFGWDFVTAASGRFGADGVWDFAAVREFELAVTIFKGVGSGQFENNCDWDPNNGPAPYQLYPQNPLGTLYAHGIASGRLNADAYPDLVVAIRNYAVENPIDPEWYGAAAVLLGKPDGSFKAPSATQAYIFRTDDIYGQFQAGGAALVEVVDLNGDGFDDIVVSNHESGELFQGVENFSVLINKMQAVSPGG